MSTVQILYDGVDITEHVLFKTANFESQLGAQPSPFSFTCKDPNQTLSFVTGKKVQLYIDGSLYYGGFVLQVTKKFAFPVDRTDSGAAAVKSRYWELRGSDFNFLFDRRVMYNKASPTSVIATIPGHPTDAYVLNYMCSNYLDLTDVDFTTHVSVVATDAAPGDVLDPDPGYGFEGVGVIWRQEMRNLAERTGAIYYFGADEALWWFDRETATPGWAFSDTPDKVTTFGFRDITFVNDATNLVNDALVWGGNQFGVTGTTAQMVFGRATDATSISTYFRSQLAEPRFGDRGFLNDTQAQNRANIIVFGDPGGAGHTLSDTNRGLQNPQQYIRLTWFGDEVPTTLVPGTVITTYLNVFGEALTLPVRNIKVSFESPTIVRYSGYFGVQTDDPFSLWKYMKKVADAGGTGVNNPLIPSSDGSAAAVLAGTEVCMVPNGSVNGSNLVFTTTDDYAPLSLRVWLNGLLQRPTVDYTETSPSGSSFSFYDAPLSGDQIWVCYTSA